MPRNVFIGILLAAMLLIGSLGGVAVAAVTGNGNDTVLHEGGGKVANVGGYGEVFKQEGNGHKNYLYTVTQFTDQFNRQCTVVTGDSEKTIAIDCK